MQKDGRCEKKVVRISIISGEYSSSVTVIEIKTTLTHLNFNTHTHALNGSPHIGRDHALSTDGPVENPGVLQEAGDADSRAHTRSQV